MAETVVDEKVIAKNDQWRERIAEQERSGMSVRKFCKERGIAEHLFFYWRKRLRTDQQPVRFALVERGAAPAEPTGKAELELVLVSGERLRIGTGVDVTTLRMVVEALRG
jgi:transposase-like protein